MATSRTSKPKVKSRGRYTANGLASGRPAARAEAHLAAAMASSEIAVFSRALDGTVVSWNTGAERLFGYTEEEALGQPAGFLLPADRLAEVPGLFARLQRGEPVVDYQTTRIRKDGTSIIVNLTMVPVRDARGKIVEVATFHRDVTSQKRSEEQAQSLVKLQAAAAGLSQRALGDEPLNELFEAAVAVVARTLGVEFCKVLELLPDGKALLLRAGLGWKEGQVGHATVGSGTDSQAGYTLMSNAPVVVEDLRTEKRFSGPPLLHQHGVVSGMSVIISAGAERFGVLGAHTAQRRTFTEVEVQFLQSVASIVGLAVRRCRTEESLRKAGTYNRSLIEASLDPLVTIGPDGKITDVNSATEAATKCPRQELIGRDFADCFTEPERARAGYEQAFREGQVRDYALSIRRHDGHLVPVLYNAAVYKDEAGKVIGVFAAARDISARKAAEEEIARQAELLNLTHDAIFVRDMQDRITFWSRGAEELYGWNSAGALGQVTHLLLRTQFPKPLPEIEKELRATGRWDGELVHNTRDGREIIAASRWSLQRDSHGAPTGTLEINNDVTQRKQVEEQREKLIEAIRQIVAQLSSLSSEILASTSEQAAGAREQAGAVSETVVTVDEVTQSAQQSAERAKSVGDAVQRTAEIGRSGRKAVDDAITALERVQEQVESSSDNIATLAEHAQSVTEIITSVDDIAEQTHLLALNAAIEAARAGEHGRGFSVVAGEIKALADQSKKATQEVRQILGEIGKASHTAVASMGEVTTRVAGTVKVSGQAGETIRTLSETLGEVSQTASEIVAAAGQQAAGMSQIAQATRNIDQAARQNAAAAEQTERAVKQLNALGTQLAALAAK